MWLYYQKITLIQFLKQGGLVKRAILLVVKLNFRD